jgi:hypothetical protein
VKFSLLILTIVMVACGTSKMKSSTEATQSWHEFMRRPAQAPSTGKMPLTLKTIDEGKYAELEKACENGEFKNFAQFRNVANKVLNADISKTIEYGDEKIMDFEMPPELKETQNTKFSDGQGAFGYYLRQTRQPFSVNGAKDIVVSSEIITLTPLDLGNESGSKESVLIQYTLNGKPICRGAGQQPSADSWANTVQDQTDRINYGTLMISDLHLKSKALPILAKMTHGNSPKLTAHQFEALQRVIADPVSSISLFPDDGPDDNVKGASLASLRAQADAVQKTLRKLIGNRRFFDGKLKFQKAIAAPGDRLFEAMGTSFQVDRLYKDMPRPNVDNPDATETP